MLTASNDAWTRDRLKQVKQRKTGYIIQVNVLRTGYTARRALTKSDKLTSYRRYEK